MTMSRQRKEKNYLTFLAQKEKQRSLLRRNYRQPFSVYYNIEFQMATIFGGSRLANLREKRSLCQDGPVKKEEPLRLGLPEEESEKVAYEPSTLSNNNRTHTRLLKGRIDRPSENAENRTTSQNFFNSTSQTIYKPKLQLPSAQTEQLRLVINDEAPKVEDKKSSVETNPMRTTQKRILIAKEHHEVQKVVEKPLEKVEERPKVVVPDVEPERPIILAQEDKPIREEDVQESLQQGENDLVECPEGCGRKFNRKALEKHAKACKLVFMSKRKEFNSEAKRLVTKEQAALAKQVKAKEKKEGKGKGKGFEKTSDNWKAASEDFRAAIKAIKKDNVDEDEKEDEEAEEKEEEMKIIPCKFCEKPFAEVFLEKHLQNCVKKRETEKKKTTKKK